jgi:chitinase
VTYSWNFGDGSTRTGSSVSKSYKTPGTYNVILTVTDEVGQQAQTIEPVTISASSTVAAFTYSPSEPVAGNSVFFNGSTSTPSNGATISSSGYSWNWGDGEPNSTGATPSHIFANPGAYTVTLTVRDSAGQSDIETSEVTVAP